MCVQCAATATVAIGSASGIRAWIRLRHGDRLGPRAMKWITAVLLTVGVLAAGIAF
jgi:hypothetical protein